MSLSRSPQPHPGAPAEAVVHPSAPAPSPRTTVTPLPILQYGLEPWVAREGLAENSSWWRWWEDSEGFGVVWRSHGPCIPTPFIHSFIHPLENGIGIILIFDS